MDLCETKASLVYILSSRLAGPTGKPWLKKTKKKSMNKSTFCTGTFAQWKEWLGQDQGALACWATWRAQARGLTLQMGRPECSWAGIPGLVVLATCLIHTGVQVFQFRCSAVQTHLQQSCGPS